MLLVRNVLLMISFSVFISIMPSGGGQYFFCYVYVFMFVHECACIYVGTVHSYACMHSVHMHSFDKQ